MNLYNRIIIDSEGKLRIKKKISKFRFIKEIIGMGVVNPRGIKVPLLK